MSIWDNFRSQDEHMDEIEAKIFSLEAQLSEARKVIEFYVDTDSWDETPNRNNLYQAIKNDVSDDYQESLRFGGKRAREFLSKHKGE